MRIYNIVFISLLLSFPSICISADGEPSKLIESSKKSHDYKVQPGDLLRISVWKEADMQIELAIRPDGKFSFPLIGEVNTKNREINDIKKEMEERLSEYIPEAIVTIIMSEPLGNKIFVIGQVNRPGEFPLVRRIDVVQALSKAGGMTPFADSKHIKILRRDTNGEQYSIPFNYAKIAKGKDLKQNIMLESGDIVLVP